MTEFVVKLDRVIWSMSWHGCCCRIMLVTRGWSLLDNCLHCSLRCGTLVIVFHAWMHSSTDVVVKLLLWHYLDYCLQDLFKRMNGELKKSVDMTLAKANRSTQFDIAKVCDPLTLNWVLSLRCIPRYLYGKCITWSYSSEWDTHFCCSWRDFPLTGDIIFPLQYLNFVLLLFALLIILLSQSMTLGLVHSVDLWLACCVHEPVHKARFS